MPPAVAIPAGSAEARVEGLPDPGTSVSVSVVGKRRIQEGRTQLTLAESLDTLPGVFVLNPYNFAQDTRIAVRGFGARSDFGIRGIRLYVDGIPATTPDGQGEVDGIDLATAGRITVLRGPASALYGAAAGGAILVETEPPPPRPTAGVRLLGGSDGLFQLQGKAGTSWDAGGAVAGISRLRYDGYRRHSRTEGTRFNAKVRTRPLRSADLTVVANLIDLPRQDDPGGLTLAEALANPRQARERNLRFDAGEEVRQGRFGALWEQELSADRRFAARAHYTRRDFANRLPFADGGQVAFERDFGGGGLLYAADTEPVALEAGADLGLQRDDRRRYENLFGVRGAPTLDQIERVRSLGAFGRAEWSFAEDWTLSGALRFDSVEFDVEDRFPADGDDSGNRVFDEWSPFAGLSWTPAAGRTFYANLKRSFETPTTTELDNPAGGGFNPDLEPQTATGAEIGARGAASAFGFPVGYQAALFRQWIEDSLVPFELPRFPEREFYRNAGASRHTGFEAAVDVGLAPGLSLAAAYAWSRFRYEEFRTEEGDFSGNRVPGIPEHYGSVSLDYEAPNGLRLAWTTRFVGPFEANDANTATIDGYSVSDFRAGWRWDRGGWTIYPFGGIKNVFDATYFANIRLNAFGGRYYEPGPERTFFGGVRVERRF